MHRETAEKDCYASHQRLCRSPHPTMKPAEGGEGEMPVTAAVLQVSAAGCRESTAALPAVGLPLVPYLAVTH